MKKCENCYHKNVCIKGASYQTATDCKLYVPAADVQEVIRCKDCKHLCKDLSGRDVHLCMRCRLPREVTLDSYCSYGAKMDGKEDEKCHI